MTTDTSTSTTGTTENEPKFCAQTFAAAGALGIVVHTIHEGFTELRDKAPGFVIPFVAVVLLTAALAMGWYRLGTRTRRVASAVLGLVWAVAASEHVANLVGGKGTALDLTGLLAVAGSLLLMVAAYWDAHRPYVVTR